MLAITGCPGEARAGCPPAVRYSTCCPWSFVTKWVSYVGCSVRPAVVSPPIVDGVSDGVGGSGSSFVALSKEYIGSP